MIGVQGPFSSWLGGFTLIWGVLLIMCCIAFARRRYSRHSGRAGDASKLSVYECGILAGGMKNALTLGMVKLILGGVLAPLPRVEKSLERSDDLVIPSLFVSGDLGSDVDAVGRHIVEMLPRILAIWPGASYSGFESRYNKVAPHGPIVQMESRLVDDGLLYSRRQSTVLCFGCLGLFYAGFIPLLALLSSKDADRFSNVYWLMPVFSVSAFMMISLCIGFSCASNKGATKEGVSALSGYRHRYSYLEERPEEDVLMALSLFGDKILLVMPDTVGGQATHLRSLALDVYRSRDAGMALTC